MTTKQKQIFIVCTALILFCAVFFYMRRSPSPDGLVYLHAEPIRTKYGWGYNILADQKLYIHQEFMPGLPGKHGFASADDALRVGNRVIEKIKANEMPHITREDLHALGVPLDSLPAK